MFRFPYQKLPVSPKKPVSPSTWSKVIHFLGSLFGNALSGEPNSGPSSNGQPPFRPFVPIRIRGHGKARRFRLALVDTGSMSTIFPSDVAPLIGIILGGHQKRLRWRGQIFPVEFQTVELELEQAGTVWHWRAPVGFSSAPLAYPLLGIHGFLEFMDAKFHGADQVVDLEKNRLFPGTNQ